MEKNMDHFNNVYLIICSSYFTGKTNSKWKYARARSYRIHGKPASYFCIALGIVSLITGLGFIPYLGLSVESRVTYYGFYKGTLERIVIYTNLLWVLILGSQFSENKNRENVG